MKPSSSTSEPPYAGPGLFDGVLARGPVRTEVADVAWLSAMLEAEAALATAQAAVGLIPAEAAAAIAAVCRPERYDIGALGRAAAGPGNPVLPLVRAVRDAAGADAAKFVHYGATSQDILDTAAMLVAHRALGALLGDLSGAANAAARLAAAHRDTPMAGRTLLQHALPVTFGLAAAGWLAALDAAADRLVVVRDTRLAVQLGGPVGTLDRWGESGQPLVARYAAELGLSAPALPWHTDRTRIADLAGALGTAAGAIGKAARDVTLLAQSDVSEVAETGGGASSAMAHKRNPVASVAAIGCATQAPGLVATLLAAMVHEHQRAAGAWHAEWRPLRELLTSVGSAAAWLRECLTGLTVHEDAMATNLSRLAAAAGLGDPAARLGAAGELVDRALAAHATRGSPP
ncbi:MAG TPA: 3-carboxy-cis,cis-muconate cycloisomerase [Micromonosporaceae bacterium]|jgi:3-carboxy-cis,cis-muconate cycloisomerase